MNDDYEAVVTLFVWHEEPVPMASHVRSKDHRPKRLVEVRPRR